MSFGIVLDALRQEQRKEKYEILARASLDIEAKTPKHPQTSGEAMLQEKGKRLVVEIAQAAKAVDEMTLDDCKKWTTQAKDFVSER